MDYKKLTEIYGVPEETLKKHYSDALDLAKKDYEGHPATVLEAFAEDATIAKIDRTKNSVIKIYRGIFLASDGRINSFAARDYDNAMREIEKIGPEEAKKRRLLTPEGRPCYPQDYKWEGKRGRPINQDDVYFTAYGVVYENKKVQRCELKVKNLDLKYDLTLNKPVTFHAAKKMIKNDVLYLDSTANTQFEYSESKDLDLALTLARERFVNIASKELPTLLTKKIEKDPATGKDVETVKVDKRLWHIKDCIISNITKTDENKTFYELTHPDILGWHVGVIFEDVKADYELMRDRRADFLVKMMTIDEENKDIHLVGYGAWQLAIHRKKNQAPFNPNTIVVKYEG